MRIGELRHSDRITGNFSTSEKEYIASDFISSILSAEASQLYRHFGFVLAT
ncbi:MAG: hypothetical protein WAM14_27145 [Candidatus Nitrosopolaris sp.]